MGSLFSREKKTTAEVLEGLEKSINGLEDFRRHTELTRKRLVGRLVFYLLVFYGLCIVIGYFYWYPKTTEDMFWRSLPLFLFPVAIWLLRFITVSIFEYRIRHNDETLLELREERKRILEEVKDKEPYKVAKEILEKFDPTTKLELAAKQRREQEEKERELIRRFSPQMSGVRRRAGVSPNVGRQPGGTPGMGRGRGGPIMTPSPQVFQTPSMNSRILPPGVSPAFTPRLARPILPQDRGKVDKIVDYLLGDGPNNRYALICVQCHSHNGMSLREDFEFLAFRCCYCNFFNPARKQRPNAPKLPLNPSDANGGSSSVRLPRRHTVDRSNEDGPTNNEEGDEDSSGRGSPVQLIERFSMSASMPGLDEIAGSRMETRSAGPLDNEEEEEDERRLAAGSEDPLFSEEVTDDVILSSAAEGNEVDDSTPEAENPAEKEVHNTRGSSDDSNSWERVDHS